LRTRIARRDRHPAAAWAEGPATGPWPHRWILRPGCATVFAAPPLHTRRRRSRNTSRGGRAVRRCIRPARAGPVVVPSSPATCRGSPPTKSASRRAAGNDRGAAWRLSPFFHSIRGAVEWASGSRGPEENAPLDRENRRVLLVPALEPPSGQFAKSIVKPRNAAMPPRISLCLIAKNEEANLPHCLPSAARLVAEIIVPDTASTDRTQGVAAQLGARVFDFAWVDSFAAVRNESLRHATGDWILWLDGDELFTEPDRQKFQALRATLGNQEAGFVMTQRSAPELAGGSPTEVQQVRLFRNHPAIRWSYRVHEQILPGLHRAGHGVCWTDVDVTHNGYMY